MYVHMHIYTFMHKYSVSAGQDHQLKKVYMYSISHHTMSCYVLYSTCADHILYVGTTYN